MKAGEHGVITRINTKFDLGGATKFSLHVERPSGSSFDVPHERFTVGAIDIDTDEGSFLANKYVLFTTAEGEFTEANDNDLKLTVDFGVGKRLKTINKILTVDE